MVVSGSRTVTVAGDEYGEYVYEESLGETADESVVEAVAEADGVRPTEVTPPLASAVDPDALESLVASLDEVDGSVEFAYGDYRVTVDGCGSVDLSRRRSSGQ
jgi:hypothetical protein